MGIEFYNTGYGKEFFQKQLPNLIKGINRLADATEKANVLKEEKLKYLSDNYNVPTKDIAFDILFNKIYEIKKLWLKLEYASLVGKSSGKFHFELDKLSDCSNIKCIEDLKYKIESTLTCANSFWSSCKSNFEDKKEYDDITDDGGEYRRYTDCRYGNKFFNEIENPICVSNFIDELSVFYNVCDGNYAVSLYDLGDYDIYFKDKESMDSFMGKNDVAPAVCFYCNEDTNVREELYSI